MRKPTLRIFVKAFFIHWDWFAGGGIALLLSIALTTWGPAAANANLNWIIVTSALCFGAYRAWADEFTRAEGEAVKNSKSQLKGEASHLEQTVILEPNQTNGRLKFHLEVANIGLHSATVRAVEIEWPSAEQSIIFDCRDGIRHESGSLSDHPIAPNHHGNFMVDVSYTARNPNVDQVEFSRAKVFVVGVSNDRHPCTIPPYGFRLL